MAICKQRLYQNNISSSYGHKWFLKREESCFEAKTVLRFRDQLQHKNVCWVTTFIKLFKDLSVKGQDVIRIHNDK